MIRLRTRWPYELWTCSNCGTATNERPPSSVIAGLLCDECIDAGARGGEPYIPLTVRPAPPTRKPDARPIIAVSMTLERCALDTGEVFDLPGLVERIRERKPGERAGNLHHLPDRLPSSIVVTDAALDLLGYLDRSPAAESPFFQWQVSMRSTGAWRPEAGSQRHYLIPKPLRFGYASRSGERRRAKTRALWFTVLEPRQFCELPDGWGGLDLLELQRFGTELRAWANRNRLPVLQGVSSYGGRLLRDARFGGGWRRKVPAATNRRIRGRLPGNHYQLLSVNDRKFPVAHKFDQQAAHHHAALRSRFPHPDRLDVTGWFRRPSPEPGTALTTRGAIRAGTEQWRELTARPGMFLIGVSVPELVAIDVLAIPPLRRPGRTWQVLTSDEIEHARTIPGVRLLDVFCAWTSPELDGQLCDYALWAGGQLPKAPRWLKPLLLATYGMLAVRPSRYRAAWRHVARHDGAVGWQTRYGQIVGYERSAKHDREPQTANVLARAIIEARVRLESLQFAQQLRAGGMRPVAIYADAVFATGQSPERLPAPWRYEGAIHDLIFDSPARYRSLEETRLPGTPQGHDGLQKVGR